MPVNSRPTTKTYVPEKPCRRCGTSLRYEATYVCVQCCSNTARDYYREHPARFIVYSARRGEKRRIERARKRTLHRLGRLPPKLKKITKSLAFWMTGRPARLKLKKIRTPKLKQITKPLAFTMTGRSVHFKRTRLKPIIGKWKSREAMDQIEATITMKPPGIVGTWSSAERQDAMTIKAGLGTMAEIFTLALFRRDASIWNRKRYAMSIQSEDDGDIIAAAENFTAPWREEGPGRRPGTAKIVQHDEHCPTCGTNAFYATNGQCRECLRVKNRKIKEAKRKAKASAPVVELRPRLSNVRVQGLGRPVALHRIRDRAANRS